MHFVFLLPFVKILVEREFFLALWDKNLGRGVEVFGLARQILNENWKFLKNFYL